MPDDSVGQQIRPGVGAGVGRGGTTENVEAHHLPDASEVLHWLGGGQRVAQPRPARGVCITAALRDE